MAITNETIIEANRKMLGNTNRTVLFAKVNLDEYLDPDVPEAEREATPTLAEMLSRINDTSDEQFLSEVRDKLTVTSFDEFLDKFQPGFYYRVRPAQQAAATATATDEAYDADGEEEGGGPATGDENGATAAADEDAVENADATGDSAGEDAPAGGGAPELEFALTGGPGWKKVRITNDHPYIRCLTDLIKKRVRQDVTTFRVDVDASLFAFKPRNQRALMRKMAEDVQVKSERLMLEAKRNKGSKDTQRALEAYKSSASDFQGALEDHVRVLPTVVYGLEETAKELKRLSPGGGPVDTNVYQIEFGKNRALIAAPRQLPRLAPGDGAKALGSGGPDAQKALGGSAGNGTAATTTAVAVRSIDNALDMIRQESHKTANQDLALVETNKKFPLVVGKFMDKMIDQNLIAPLMGNLVATVLQNPKELALVSPDIHDVEHYHDVFLGMYTNAVGSFLQTVTPVFETIMGVYLLFNEFPRDVRIAEGMKPELILANADLPDLFLTRPDELKKFFDISCAQAANQFRDAISFVIVPNVAPFKKKRPPKKKAGGIDILGDLVGDIEAAQGAQTDDSESYGRVTFIDEMMSLMEWGYQYGFQVLFSPEERVRAGRSKRDDMAALADAYAIGTVVDKDFANCAVLCLPDFVIMPPDGKLITGRTAEGNIEVGVDVPELNVRACFVAAGRLMANDVPEYLKRKLQKARKDPTQMRMDLPGVGIDLGVNPYLGETDLPTDHFLNDGMMGELLSPAMPFLVFTHVSGRSPFLSVPRTMRRIQLPDGSQTYASLHLFRQLIYIRRLLSAAHELGFGGALPQDNAKAEAQIASHFDYVLKWTNWYDPDKLVNSFPSRLKEGEEYSVKREDGNNFKLSMGFEQGLIAEFGLSF